MIREFKDNYRWLSNFYPCKVVYNGKIFMSVENAYQSAKWDDDRWIKFCQIKSPGIVKSASREVKIDRKMWDQERLKVMEICLSQKFYQEPFKSMLITTGVEELQEGNNWGDEFWGVNLKTGKGQNQLGKLIMLIRDRLNGTKF